MVVARISFHLPAVSAAEASEPSSFQANSLPAKQIIINVNFLFQSSLQQASVTAHNHNHPSFALSLARMTPLGIGRFTKAFAKRFHSSGQVENLVKFGEYLTSCLPKFIEKVTVSPRGGELNVYVPVSGLLPCLQFLRDHHACQYAQLMDLTAVDWPADSATKGRFELIYCLLSLRHNSRLVVHCRAPSSTNPSVPSVTSLYSSANWAERETYDMFGIMFEGHPDLRRILTDYGFEGHPLRKDFPLTGFVEVRYDEEKKRVIEEPVELTQEFRKYEYSSPVRLNA